MTDKEFKRLSRSQLIEIIYQLQLKQEELTAENDRLAQALEDKRLRIGKTGSIAEAALEIHNVMQTAQAAADHYLQEIQIRADEEYRRIVQGARDEAVEILQQARQQAAEIAAQAQKAHTDYDAIVEDILKEYSAGQTSGGNRT